MIPTKQKLSPSRCIDENKDQEFVLNQVKRQRIRPSADKGNNALRSAIIRTVCAPLFKCRPTRSEMYVNRDGNVVQGSKPLWYDPIGSVSRGLSLWFMTLWVFLQTLFRPGWAVHRGSSARVDGRSARRVSSSPPRRGFMMTMSDLRSSGNSSCSSGTCG